MYGASSSGRIDFGGAHPMIDEILGRFAEDEQLGLVFPSDPHLCDWDANRAIAEKLARRIGITETLPPFFEFPIGTMFSGPCWRT